MWNGCSMDCQAFKTLWWQGLWIKSTPNAVREVSWDGLMQTCFNDFQRMGPLISGKNDQRTDLSADKGLIGPMSPNNSDMNDDDTEIDDPEAFESKDHADVTRRTSTTAVANAPQYEHLHESSMRLATDISIDDRRNRRRNRRKKIRARRGAFSFLPVYCSNDLVHGSWWFVLGSVLATVIPIVPLVDLFYPFWPIRASLPLLADATTFALMIVSGFFFTVGSLAFVRATEEPPLRPLFAAVTVHLETDELLAAWMFLLGTIPFPILMVVYLNYDHTIIVYWGCFIVSTLFVIVTYFFVLTCYPSDEERNYQIAPYISRLLFSERCWVHKHLSNDWLASTWLFFYATLVMVLGSLGMFLLELVDGGNQLDIFDWASCTLDALIFLIGSAYFCAGSYPRYENNASREPEEKPLLGAKGLLKK